MADENKRNEPILPEDDNEHTIPNQKLDADSDEMTIESTAYPSSEITQEHQQVEPTVSATQYDAEMTQIEDYDEEQTMPNALYSQEMAVQPSDDEPIQDEPTVVDPSSLPAYQDEG
ncbi:MAG: hypothetical protein CUN57_00730, partial [Phototrophicales bacterium]